MDLDAPLGRWLPVPRNTWFPAYRTTTGILWRRENSSQLLNMMAMGAPGFYRIDGEVAVLPLYSHPIRMQQMGDELWTHKPFMMERVESTRLEAGTVLQNSISDPRIEVLEVGSDGSLHLQDKLAACAWILYSDEDQQVRGCYLLEKMTSLSSYRCELEGMYRSLRQVLLADIKPDIIHQWCDNEAAVDRSNQSLFSPSCMIKPEADILLAMAMTRSQLDGTTIICRHVYGHQDTKHRNPSTEEEAIDWDREDVWDSRHDECDRHTQRVEPLSVAARINIKHRV